MAVLIATYSNASLGVVAHVLEAENGTYTVSIEDTDAEASIGVRIGYATLQAAADYASKAVA